MPGYFEKWLYWKACGIGELTADQACKRHGVKPYVAAMFVDGLRRVVDIGGKWLTVMFYDSHNRCELRYDFQKVEPTELFLSMAVKSEYAEAGAEPLATVTFAFRRSGLVLIERKDRDGIVEQKEQGTDLNSNWESYPAFGSYELVCRRNR